MSSSAAVITDITKACQVLKLPPNTISTAHIYFHKIKHAFFYPKRHRDSQSSANLAATSTTTVTSTDNVLTRELILITCLNLATKTTEEPRKLRDIINVVYCLLQEPPVEFMRITSDYWKIRESVGKVELLFLREMRFDVSFKLAYPWIQRIVTAMLNESPTAKAAIKLSFTIAADVYGKGMGMDGNGREVACAIVYIVYRSLGLNLPVEFGKWCHYWTRIRIEQSAGAVSKHINKILSIFTHHQQQPSHQHSYSSNSQQHRRGDTPSHSNRPRTGHSTGGHSRKSLTPTPLSNSASLTPI